MAAEANVREHLANERTFLAWVRTSIALLGFGVVIVKLRFLTPEAGPQAGLRSTWLGLAFAAVGVLTLLFATWHYQRTRQQIETGAYRPLGRALLAFAAAITLLGIVSLVYLVVISPR